MIRTTLAVLCIASVQAGTPTLPPAPYSVKAKYDATLKSVVFTIVTKDIGWFGLGFGHAMDVGNDMIMCSVPSSGVAACTDFVSAGEKAPTKDTVQNVKATAKKSATSAGFTEITVIRALDTTDAKQDYIIPLDKLFEVSWSYNDKSAALD